MGRIKSYKELRVWQKSVDLAEETYNITVRFPREERYNLASQMRRAAISVPSNVAEGCLRKHTNELIHFLHIALGSCGELDTQLIIAGRLKYVSGEETKLLTEEIDYVSRMLRNFVKKLVEKNEPRATNHKPRTANSC